MAHCQHLRARSYLSRIYKLEAFLQDIAFYAVVALIAYYLLNDTGGGGKRNRVFSAV